MTSPWKTIANAPDQGVPRLPFLPAGVWPDLTVLRVARIESKKPHQRGKWFFVVEVSTDGMAASEAYAWVVDLSRGDMALTDCKAFAAAVLPGVEITEDIMLGMEGDKQPATGIRISAVAEARTTTSGNAFTKIYWAPRQQD